MAEFKELLKILEKEVPSRPVLFEFYLNERLYRRACKEKYDVSTPYAVMRTMVRSFEYYGYDYATVRGSEYWFSNGEAQEKATVSLNAGHCITDRGSFDSYPWMDAAACDYSALQKIETDLPRGMKVVVMGPGGVLENCISLVGFDNLCMMLYDDRELVGDIFERIGSGLVEYYRRCAAFDSVGALISNDDWGFNTQTMLSPADLKEFVFPWHKRIVEVIHDAQKPGILHSCGNYTMIFDDLLALGYDARHSYEDNIVPVEQAYEQFAGKMAVLGGIDVNYLITASEYEITARCKKMLDRASSRGGYALGSGNSIPDYVPDEKYFAMLRAIGDKQW